MTESKYGRNVTAVTKNEARINYKIITGQEAYITNTNQSTTNNETESTQYETVYTKTDSNSYTENYTINTNKVFGDGIMETSTAESKTTSWNSAYSAFVGLEGTSNCPFFIRGGGFSE